MRALSLLLANFVKCYRNFKLFQFVDFSKIGDPFLLDFILVLITNVDILFDNCDLCSNMCHKLSEPKSQIGFRFNDFNFYTTSPFKNCITTPIS